MLTYKNLKNLLVSTMLFSTSMFSISNPNLSLKSHNRILSSVSIVSTKKLDSYIKLTYECSEILENGQPTGEAYVVGGQNFHQSPKSLVMKIKFGSNPEILEQNWNIPFQNYPQYILLLESPELYLIAGRIDILVGKIDKTTKFTQVWNHKFPSFIYAAAAISKTSKFLICQFSNKCFVFDWTKPPEKFTDEVQTNFSANRVALHQPETSFVIIGGKSTYLQISDISKKKMDVKSSNFELKSSINRIGYMEILEEKSELYFSGTNNLVFYKTDLNNLELITDLNLANLSPAILNSFWGLVKFKVLAGGNIIIGLQSNPALLFLADMTENKIISQYEFLYHGYNFCFSKKFSQFSFRASNHDEKDQSLDYYFGKIGETCSDPNIEKICKICAGKGNNCLECKKNFWSHLGNCLKKCPENFYKNFFMKSCDPFKCKDHKIWVY